MYHSYRRIVAKAIVDPRAYLQLRSVALGGAEEALARFDPQVVVWSRSSAEYPSGRRAAWAEPLGRGPQRVLRPRQRSHQHRPGQVEHQRAQTQ